MKYRKVLFFVIVIIVIYLIYFLYHDKTLSYVALGDGFALGENPYGEVTYGYPDFLMEQIKDGKNIRLFTKDFSNKSYCIRDLYKDIIFDKKILINDKTLSLKSAIRDADFLTLSIGVNDVFSKLSFNEVNKLSNEEIVSDVIKDMDSLLKEISKYNRDIILVGYYNFYLNRGDNDIFKLLNSEYKRLSNNYDIVYIDTYNLIGKGYLDNPNSFYPNQDGYKVISKEIVNYLKNKKGLNF